MHRVREQPIVGFGFPPEEVPQVVLEFLYRHLQCFQTLDDDFDLLILCQIHPVTSQVAVIRGPSRALVLAQIVADFQPPGKPRAGCLDIQERDFGRRVGDLSSSREERPRVEPVQQHRFGMRAFAGQGKHGATSQSAVLRIPPEVDEREFSFDESRATRSGGRNTADRKPPVVAFRQKQQRPLLGRKVARFDHVRGRQHRHERRKEFNLLELQGGREQTLRRHGQRGAQRSFTAHRPHRIDPDRPVRKTPAILQPDHHRHESRTVSKVVALVLEEVLNHCMCQLVNEMGPGHVSVNVEFSHYLYAALVGFAGAGLEKRGVEILVAEDDDQRAASVVSPYRRGDILSLVVRDRVVMSHEVGPQTVVAETRPHARSPGLRLQPVNQLGLVAAVVAPESAQRSRFSIHGCSDSQPTAFRARAGKSNNQVPPRWTRIAPASTARHRQCRLISGGSRERRF